MNAQHVEVIDGASIGDLASQAADLGFERSIVSIEPSQLTFDSPSLPTRVVGFGWARGHIESYISVDMRNDPLRRQSVRQSLALTNMPVIWEIREGVLRFDQAQVKCSHSESAVVTKAIDCGIVTGFSTPVFAPLGSVAIVTFYSRKPRTEALAYQATHDRLFVLSHEMAHRLAARCNGAATSDDGVRFKLSPRELQCLEWTSLGKNSSEIAGILSLSVETVRGYLKSAAAKLHVSSRAQMVSKAFKLGLLH